jgi:hypothetical protein
LVGPGSDPVELAVPAQRGAGCADLVAGDPVPGQLDDLVEAERPVRLGVYAQDERDDSIVGGALAAGGGAVGAGGVRGRCGSGLMLRPGPELGGRDAGQPGGLIDQGRAGAAQRGPDHAQRAASGAAKAGTGYGCTGASLPILDEIPSTVLVAANRSSCHLHMSCIASAHARVAVL